MDEPTHKVPALRRGLRIIETLANSRDPLTLSAIASELDVPVSSIQRMVQQLDQEGYILRNSAGGYYLSNKIFRIAVDHSAEGLMLSAALPAMRQFVRKTGESVHLSVAVSDQFVVIGQLEGTGYVRVTVRPGSYPLSEYPSGKLLLVFESRGADATLLQRVPQDEQEQLRREQSSFSESLTRRGVFHLAVPVILRDGNCVAALATSFVVPFDQSSDGVEKRDQLVRPLREAAESVARQIG